MWPTQPDPRDATGVAADNLGLPWPTTLPRGLPKEHGGGSARQLGLVLVRGATRAFLDDAPSSKEGVPAFGGENGDWLGGKGGC